jgi:hypothetical protein
MHQGHIMGFVNLIQRVIAGSLVGVFVVALDVRRLTFQIRGENALRAID